MKTTMVKSTDRSRAIQNAYQRQYPKAVITQSYLRLEKTLGTQSTITFDVLNQQGTSTATLNEKRLNLTDNFLATEISIFIYKIASGANISSAVLSTNPNSLVFTGSGESAALMNIYNGFMSIKINNNVLVDSLDCYRFYRAGVAQNGLAASSNATVNLYTASQWDAGSWGFAPSTPGIEFGGAKKNEVTITCPQSIAMAGTSSTNYVVAYFRGLLAQNAAQWQSSKG